MSSYEQFLAKRKRGITESGFRVSSLPDKLFDFQKYAVERAVVAGRYALFEECGLGKTFQQVAWADQIVKHTNEPVCITAPLGVTGQTIKEAAKLDIDVARVGGKSDSKIYITNYEQIENLTNDYAGIVLDESSILKSVDGKTKQRIFDLFAKTPYKLACTATPSPNDDMEMCNHAEFLNHGRRVEILATYFTHDGGETSKWRLKGHAQKVFWNFVKSWSMFISNPSDVGFDGSRFVLPKLNLIERVVSVPNEEAPGLFNDMSVSATDFNRELRRTAALRIKETADIAHSKSKEQFIVWCKQNEESKVLASSIKGAVEVVGSESPEAKEEKLLAFASGEIRVLVTKTKIAGFGMNFQNCHNQIHASLDFSFESLYQSIRRSYRFGQKHPVNIWLITTDTMTNVIQSIKAKQEQFELMKYHLTQN